MKAMILVALPWCLLAAMGVDAWRRDPADHRRARLIRGLSASVATLAMIAAGACSPPPVPGAPRATWRPPAWARSAPPRRVGGAPERNRQRARRGGGDGRGGGPAPVSPVLECGEPGRALHAPAGGAPPPRPLIPASPVRVRLLGGAAAEREAAGAGGAAAGPRARRMASGAGPGARRADGAHAAGGQPLGACWGASRWITPDSSRPT